MESRGRTRYSRSKSQESADDSSNINLSISGSSQKVPNANSFGNGWDLNNPITLSSDDGDTSESEDNPGNKSERANHRKSQNDSYNESDSNIESDIEGESDIENDSNSNSEPGSSDESEEIPLSQLKVNKNEREIAKLKSMDNIHSYKERNAPKPINLEEKKKHINQDNGLTSFNNNGKISSSGNRASKALQQVNNSENNYDIPLSRYSKRAANYGTTDTTSHIRSRRSFPGNSQPKKNVKQNPSRSFEIVDDYLDQTNHSSTNLLTASPSSSFEIIDEDESLDEQENNVENIRTFVHIPGISRVPNSRADLFATQSQSHSNKFVKEPYKTSLQNKSNHISSTLSKKNDTSNNSANLLSNSKLHVNPKSSKELLVNKTSYPSRNSFVVPDHDSNIFLVSSSSSSSSDLSSLDFEKDQHSEPDSSDDYKAKNSSQDKNITSSKEQNILSSADYDNDGESNSCIKDNMETDLSMNEDNKIDNLLDSMQNSGSPNQQDFDSLSNSIKLSRLEQLVQKSKVFSQIIADTLLQSSLERKKSKEKNKENKDKTGNKYHNDSNICETKNDNELNNSKKGRKSKKKKNGGIISMYPGASSNITAETLKTKEKLTNGNAGTREQPKLIKGATLRDYQLDGLDWLVTLYENGLNGILADEMGLGKTLQSISLLAFLYENNNKGPFLVACPLSTVGNWYKEVTRFAPDIPCLKYSGSKEERENLRSKYFMTKNRNRLSIVITSYEIILRDRRYLDKFNWKFLIVDEGHRLKNINSKLIKELKKLKTENRLLITGTPLQNNLDELWSLLNFILPDIFQDIDLFHQWFNFSPGSQDKIDDEVFTSKIQAQLVENLHTILKPFILRRLKKVVIKSLPPKREYIIYCKLSDMQVRLYEAALSKTFRSILPQIAFREYISVNNLQVPEELIREFIDSKILKLRPSSEVIDLHNDANSITVSNKAKRVSKPINYNENNFNQFEGDVSDDELSDINVYKNNYYEKDELYVDQAESNSKLRNKRVSESENESLPQKRVRLSREERVLNDFRKSNNVIPSELLTVFDINMPSSQNIARVKKAVTNKSDKVKNSYFINFSMDHFLALLDRRTYDSFIFHNEKDLYKYSDLFTDIFELSIANENLIQKNAYLQEVAHIIQIKGYRLVIDNLLLRNYENKMIESQNIFSKKNSFDELMPDESTTNADKSELSVNSSISNDLGLIEKELENSLINERSQANRLKMHLLFRLDVINQQDKKILMHKKRLIKKFHSDWASFLTSCSKSELYHAAKCQTKLQQQELSQKFYNIKKAKLDENTNILNSRFDEMNHFLGTSYQEKRQINFRILILSIYKQIEFLDTKRKPSFEMIFQKFISPDINLNEQMVRNFEVFCKALISESDRKLNIVVNYSILMPPNLSKESISENETDSDLREALSNKRSLENYISSLSKAKIANTFKQTDEFMSNFLVSPNMNEKSKVSIPKEQILPCSKENLTVSKNKTNENTAGKQDEDYLDTMGKHTEVIENDSKDDERLMKNAISKDTKYDLDTKAKKDSKDQELSASHSFSSSSTAQTLEQNPTSKSYQAQYTKGQMDKVDAESPNMDKGNDVGIDFKTSKDKASNFTNTDILPSKQHFTAKMKKKYTNTLNHAWEEISNEIKHKNYGNLMMQLRSICDSPYSFFFPWMDENNVSRNLIENSGKMEILDQLLTRLLADNHKVLIFSQFTTMLDLLEDYLTYKELGRCRLDGTSSQAQREKSIKTFYDDDDCNIFLLSTRAGGLGINLVAADTVIIFDSDWNPQVDLQAMDRAHRLGQTKPVIVYRFTTMNTVEQLLLARADTKRNLEKVVIQLGEFESLLNSNSSNMNSKELSNFFQANVFQANSDIKDNKLSKEELDELLDRSHESYRPRTCVLNHLELFNSSDVGSS